MQVADVLSQGIRIKSGVHQGSLGWPILFLLFDNDLPSVINVLTLIMPTTSRWCHQAHKAALCRAPSTTSGSGRELGTSFSIPPNVIISRLGGLLLFNYPESPGETIQVANVVRPGRSHGQLFHTLDLLQRGCLQSKT